MSTPDIRVKLTPEGLKDVIAALRAVQAEAVKSNKIAGEGLGLANNALRDLKSLLPSLGLAAVVGGFIALTKHALDTADATGKLQQKVGGTVEDISALTLAFRTNESDQAGLQDALLKTANLMAKVRANAPEAVDALQAIGVNAADLAGLSTPRQLEQIAVALQKIPPGGDRAAATFALFGKSSKDLVVALDAVGREGIDQFIAKARELGVLIDDDLAQAAARAKDSLGIIKIQAEGLATQFASGLAPAVADAMESFSKSVTGDGVNGMQLFGRGVGFIIRAIVASFQFLGRTVGAIVASMGVSLRTFIEQAKALAHLDFRKVAELELQKEREKAAIAKSLKEDLAEIGTDLFSGPKAPKKKPEADQSETILPPVDNKAKETAAARLAFLRAQLQNELKVFQEGAKLTEQLNKNAYDQGLISLKEYFEARRQLLEASQAKELQVLRAERAAVAAELKASSVDTGTQRSNRQDAVSRFKAAGDPEEQKRIAAELSELDARSKQTDADRLRLKSQLAELDAKILSQEIGGQRELAALGAEQIAAQKQIDDERRASLTKLAEAEHNRHAVFQANLEEEIKAIRELGAKAGASADEVEAHIQRLTDAREAQFDFDKVTREGQAALTAFSRDAELIARDQQAGIITQLEGEQRLIDLEGKRLELLRRLADQITIAAEKTGDLEAVQKAREFSDSVEQIGLSYRAATDEITKFKTAGKEATQAGLESLFANIDKIHSVGDAFESLANTVAQALLKMAAEILAQRATLALFGAFSAAPATGQTGGQVVQRKAAGDIVAGPGLNIPGVDRVPALLQPGEFIVRKAAVSRPGALSFLRAFNRGAIRSAAPVARFAAGGLVGAASMPGVPSGNRMVQQNITVQTQRDGSVSRLTLNQTAAAAARGITEANRRDN